MRKEKAPQKLVSFSNSKADFYRISQEMEEGWAIISLIQNGNYYVGIMEKMPYKDQPDGEDVHVFIPPRKKITVLY